MRYSLFDGRHELPENVGAICSGFNFSTFTVEKTELWDKALYDNDCEIIVTGLTPALTQFISEYVFQTDGFYNRREIYTLRLTLLHFNSATKEYVKQIIL